MFGNQSSSLLHSESDFLDAIKIEVRGDDGRLSGKQREASAIRIQAAIRGWLCLKCLMRDVRLKFDLMFIPFTGKAKLSSSLKMYEVSRRFLLICYPMASSSSLLHSDRSRFLIFCKYLVISFQSNSQKLSYVGLAFNQSDLTTWISHVKKVLTICTKMLASTKVGSDNGGELSTLLTTLVTLTSIATWSLLKSNEALNTLVPGMEQLCANFLGHLINKCHIYSIIREVLLQNFSFCRSHLSKTSLTALMIMVWRPLIAAKFSHSVVSQFLIQILSIPALIQRLKTAGVFVIDQNRLLLTSCVSLLSQEHKMKVHFNALDGSYALCLMANLVHLLELSSKNEFDHEKYDYDEVLFNIVLVLTRLMELCGEYVTSKQSNLSHWHPILGWFSVSLDRHLQEAMDLVKLQLAFLWSPSCLEFFVVAFRNVVQKQEMQFIQQSKLSSNFDIVEPTSFSIIQRSFGDARCFVKNAIIKTRERVRLFSTEGPDSDPNKLATFPTTKLGSSDSTKIAMVCMLYQVTLRTLGQMRLEILSGLCYHNILLKPLWCTLQSFGLDAGAKVFLDHLTMNPKGTAPEFHIFTLYADCLSYLVTLIDDMELYELQKPITLDQLLAASALTNTFLFRALNNGLIKDSRNSIFVSLYGLLCVLYRRDNRRRYTPDGHWLAPKDIKISSLLSEVQKGDKVFLLQKMPHVFPHDNRIVLFRKRISESRGGPSNLFGDRIENGEPVTQIVIHRHRIVEDGYRQLAGISSKALKGIIRVKFINIRGLNEAGIDQDGVFKEFLEETVKRVFDPGFNLFTCTTQEKLYPSPNSSICAADNDLALFEFVGKMIGKAVYEGIVIDVSFADFFLSQVLGKDLEDKFYSYVDELASFDDELSRNLAYVKHYSGNVEADLGLTFSVDSDCLGSINTYELVPGGCSIPVTNYNRISYVHNVAKFRMHTQIKNQVAAFRKGFLTLVSPSWLCLFCSASELQRLIAGDDRPLDLQDLRSNTKYFGGFHDSHRVVGWLWHVLEKDFNTEEKKAFLKFVTSCTKAPLLGFRHLEPPFSIRCVDVTYQDDDDDDEEDTLGSVVRGFLSIRGRKDRSRMGGRLPSASTCFNLLKLPNYQKKSILRDKLRYAISSNTGFELS